MKVYRIYDWVGNDKSDYYGTFNSFEEAWSRLCEECSYITDEKEFEEQMGEFYIYEDGEKGE